MPSKIPGIVLFDEVEGFRDAHAQMVQVPLDVDEPSALMQLYCDALELPDECRDDWHALEGCLRDRLAAGERFVIVHKDLPALGGVNDQRAYIRMFQRLNIADSPSRLTAVFPETARWQLCELVEL